MDPIFQSLLNQFIGGELEVQNEVEKYLFRGKITALESLLPAEGYSHRLKVTLEWNTKATGDPHTGSYLPVNGWDEVTDLEYICDTTLPTPDLTKEYPNVNFQVVDNMWRAIIINPYTNETTVLFQRGGSQLDLTRVRWLPNGPKAQSDARRSAA